MGPTSNSFHCSEIDTLHSLRQFADEIKEDADKWSTRLADSILARDAAEANFGLSLSDKSFKTLADRQTDVRNLTDAVKIIEASGGSAALRRKALARPEVFAALTAGLTRRLAELEKLKPAAAELLGKRRSEATVAAATRGVASVILDAVPAVAAARDTFTQVQNAAQAALVARNYAACGGVNCTPTTFESLLTQLESPLPALPI